MPEPFCMLEILLLASVEFPSRCSAVHAYLFEATNADA
jgi:hypothetical protein